MRPLVLNDLVARLGRWSAGRGPLYLLLAGRLRQLIDDGELRPDTALPPDRTLAGALAVGRTTVVAAYDLLADEGKIVRRQGSGTRVAPAPPRPAPDPAIEWSNPLFLHLLDRPDQIIQLTCAAPDTVPDAVRTAYARAVATPINADIGYYPSGLPALRTAIAARYTRRGLPTTAEQILVTTGAQQALFLLARRLISPGDAAVVEAPTYPGALEVFRDAAAVLRPVPHTPAGLDVDALIQALRQHRPALAYLIPTFHNPTGAVLSALARRRVAEAAAEVGVPLIEDEVLAELGFTDDPPPSLATTGAGAVLTIGSLSKIVWGGLRVGWVRGPAALIAQLARLKAIHDLGTDVFAQLAAAELVADLDTIRAQRTRELRAAHDRLCAELTEQLPDWRFTPVHGGQTLWVRLPHGDAISFAQRALRHGVAVLAGNSLDASGHSADRLRIPFLVQPDEFTEIVRRLAAAWQDHHAGADPAVALPSLVI